MGSQTNDHDDGIDGVHDDDGTFATATELCGSIEQGLDDDYVKHLGRALCTFLVQSGLNRNAVMVAEAKSTSSSLQQALIDGLLLGGAEVIDLGPLTLSQFELCQFAAKASAGVYLARSKIKEEVREGTFLDATQEESLCEDSSEGKNATAAAHGVSIFVEQVPQTGERLQSLESLMSTAANVSGEASYRRGTYEEWVPDAETAEALRAQAHSKTIVEKNVPS
ncbi:MAG: hypothetical protein GY822_24425 [Deltaproteobacteria bacterium]|nr:hypothetical protein [Deltaproteobacteria bacterium]